MVPFLKTEASLSAVAAQKFAEDDWSSAMSFCYECEKKGKLEPSLYASMAECLFSYGLYVHSANCWFEYLNLVTKKNFIRAYNGLGACYQMHDVLTLADYYYNLQLSCDNDKELLYDGYMYNFYNNGGDGFEKDEIYAVFKALLNGGETDSSPSIRLVKSDSSSSDKDWREVYYSALERLDDEPVTAENLLSFIPPESPYYAQACYERALLAVRLKLFDTALEMFKNPAVASKHSDSAAYIYGIYFYMRDEVGAAAAYAELKRSNGNLLDALDCFSVMLSAIGEYERAYDYAISVLALSMHDARIFKVVGKCAFNAGKYEESSEYFYKYYQLTRDPCVGYYRTQALKALSGGADIKKIYDCEHFPKAEEERLISSVAGWLLIARSTLKRRADEVYEKADSIFYIDNFELQSAVCQIIAALGGERSKSFLKKKLLRFDINETIKTLIISLLVQMGHDKLTGIVFSGFYFRVQFERVEFIGEKDFIFTEAYSIAFGRFVPYGSEAKLYKIKTAAYEIFNKLSRNGNAKKINDVVALAAVIAIQSKAVELSKSSIIEYFEAKRSAVKNIEELIKKE